MRTHLIVDCTPEEERVSASFRALLGPAPARVVPVPHDELPRRASEFASILVTGSPASVCAELAWLPPLFELLRDAARCDVPVLGVCFGHQAIARALCGPQAVRRAPRSELGWVEIERSPWSPLFDRFPLRFPCFVSHFDEVVPGLAPLEVLARSARCPVHAFRVRGRRMWGVQFHPELPPSLCAELVRAKLADHAYLGEDPRPVLERSIDARALGRSLVASFLQMSELRWQRAPRPAPSRPEVRRAAV